MKLEFSVHRPAAGPCRAACACQPVRSTVHRSLSAAEQLSRAGYSTIAWVNGGLDTSKKADLPVKGADDLRYGGIGGLSELLGWTDVQREKNTGALGGPSGPIKFVRLFRGTCADSAFSICFAARLSLALESVWCILATFIKV